MRPIVLIGANGQLGSDLVIALKSLRNPLIPLLRRQLDIRNHQNVRRVLAQYDPEFIVNTAAFHKVEECEGDPAQAFSTNCLAVRNLAIIAENLEAWLVHISTDYVFDGDCDSPYTEDDNPNPINSYGASKLAGEIFARNFCRRSLIIRTSGLYGRAGSSGKGGNFVRTMLRLGHEGGPVKVVDDQTLAPTYTVDLAMAISSLMERRARGLFHVTNSGCCSWYEFAYAIFELARMDVDTKRVSTESTARAVRRPRYSVLANRQLELAGLTPLRPWRDALRAYLAECGDIQSGTVDSRSVIESAAS